MHPVAFRKAMIEAYLSGAANIIDSGLTEYPTKKEASNWFDDEYGMQETEKCGCCEEKDEE